MRARRLITAVPVATDQPVADLGGSFAKMIRGDMRHTTSTSRVISALPCKITPKPSATTNSTLASASLRVICVRSCTRFNQGIPRDLHFIEKRIILTHPLEGCEAEVIFQKRQLDSTRLGTLNGCQAIIGSPELLQLRRQGIGSHARTFSFGGENVLITPRRMRSEF